MTAERHFGECCAALSALSGHFPHTSPSSALIDSASSVLSVAKHAVLGRERLSQPSGNSPVSAVPGSAAVAEKRPLYSDFLRSYSFQISSSELREPNPKKMAVTEHTDGKAPHLQRRSSFQKIMHICNQGYSLLPHLLIRLQDTDVSVDFAGLIEVMRSTFLNVVVSLAVVTLFAQFLLLVGAALYYLKGPFFLTGCVILLGALAFKCLTTGRTANRAHRSLSCRKKWD